MEGTQRRALALLSLGVLVLAMLACGGFQVRVTPTAGATKTPTKALAAATAAATPQTEQALAARTPTATATLTATPAAPAQGGSILTPGGKARVAADMVNVRSEAKAGASRVGSLNTGTVVTIQDGPVVADNYTWYKVDNGSGTQGWVAMGPVAAPWLVPDTAAAPTRSAPHLVDRAIKVGDRVQVTTKEGQQLTVRDGPSKKAEAAARVMPGTQFIVKGGPTQADNMTWWQLEGEEVKGWAVEGDAETRWLTPVEQ